jgi:hypothetical protein
VDPERERGRNPLAQCISTLEGKSVLTRTHTFCGKKSGCDPPGGSKATAQAAYVHTPTSTTFLKGNKEQIQKKLYDEFSQAPAGRENEYFRRAGFLWRTILSSLGRVHEVIPGKMNRVFEEDNFDCGTGSR